MNGLLAESMSKMDVLFYIIVDVELVVEVA
jgi:hypothetical protein